jgi:DNA repair protein RadC
MLVGEWTDTCRSVVVSGPEDVGDELCDAFGGLPQEVLVSLLLSPARVVLECALVALGSGNVTHASSRDVFRPAIQQGAHSVLLAHNHPSGFAAPTTADLEFTKRLLKGGQVLGVEVVDHLVITARGWRSLRESTGLWAEG